jgi:CRISPR-associated protein Cmr6
MSREIGKLKVSNKLSGTIKSGRTVLSIPKEYELAPRERFNGVECEYELDGGTVVKVFVDGTELPKDTAAAERKAVRIKERELQEEQERQAKENEKKFKSLNAPFKNDSFDIKKTFCPKDTAELDIQPFQVENFALKLNRFARFVENERDYSKSNFEFFKSGKKEPEHQIIDNYGDTDFKALTDRNKINAKILFGDNCEVFTKSTSGRLITGLGGASVYETDITLHHIYGFPYLPGSGIKGVVRSWIIQNVFAENEDGETDLGNAEKRALNTDTNNSKAFCEIFGCPKDSVLKKENQGKVQFFDAYPTEAPKVVPDLMNPHYGPYYNGDGKTPPADYHNPIPIFFLTVDKKTEFQFILGSKDSEWKDWIIAGKTIENWLKDALENHGIGAKTAVGYGYMSE